MSALSKNHVDERAWIDLRAKCLAGDEQAWSELDARLRPVARRWFARLCSDPDRADDLTQVFLSRLYEDGARRLASFNPDYGVPLLSYLQVIATRLHHDWIRSREGLDRNRWIDLDDQVERLTGPCTDPLLRYRLESAVAALRPADRIPLMLLAYGLSYEEIASEVGVTPGGAAARISRARARLRDLLEGGEDVPGRRMVLDFRPTDRQNR